MKASDAIEELKGRSTSPDPKGWSAQIITIGRVQMKSVSVHDRGGCIDLIDVLGSLVDKTRRTRRAAWETITALTIPAQGPTKLLSEATKVFLADCLRRNLSESSIFGYEHTLWLLMSVSGDVPISTISQDHIRKLWDYVRWIPRNPKTRRQYRDLSVEELVAAGRAEQLPSPSAHVFNKHWRLLRAFFTTLIETKALSVSPMEGLNLEVDTDNDPTVGREFTDAELIKLFDPKTFLPWTHYLPHRFWIPQLALYTGARVNELAQLKVADVQQIEGRWVILIRKTFSQGSGGAQTPRTTNQRAKSKASIRTIPIAEPLLDAGFLDFVEDIRETTHPRLFPHLSIPKRRSGEKTRRGYGCQMVSQFGRYVRKTGLEPGVAMHAFRHTMITALADAEVPDPIVAALTGHEKQVTYAGLKGYQHHSVGVGLGQVAEALKKFKPPVKLFRYKRGLFREQLKDGWKFHP